MIKVRKYVDGNRLRYFRGKVDNDVQSVNLTLDAPHKCHK